MKNKDPPIAKSILKYTQKTDFFLPDFNLY